MIYIIPTNAATPAELSHLIETKGTFSERIAAAEKAPAAGALLALAPAEVLALAKSPEVFNLGECTIIDGLPGAFYDPLFMSSAAQLGARVELWEALKATMKRAKAETQRMTDTKPWNAPAPAASGPTAITDADGEAED